MMSSQAIKEQLNTLRIKHQSRITEINTPTSRLSEYQKIEIKLSVLSTYMRELIDPILTHYTYTYFISFRDICDFMKGHFSVYNVASFVIPLLEKNGIIKRVYAHYMSLM